MQKIKKEEQKPSTARGTASLVLGILSICLTIMPYFSIPMGILGIIFSNLQRRVKETSVATAGLVLSIIGVVLGISLCLMLMLFWSLYTA